MRALVVADGDVPARAELDAAWPGWCDGVELVVAADGGAARAESLAILPDLLVGDLDSLSPERVKALRGRGVEVRVAPVEKDESDSELALLATLERGATDVTILGAFGGPRLDHALANVGLLALPGLGERRVRLLDARWRVGCLVAPGSDGGPVTAPFAGRVGDLVSLLPQGTDAEGVTTEGLRYPLRDEPLRAGPARGLSNVRTAPSAHVSLRRGVLLVVETTVAGTLQR